jgi:hypothetical protein
MLRHADGYDSESGRGMWLVDALTEGRWGTEPGAPLGLGDVNGKASGSSSSVPTDRSARPIGSSITNGIGSPLPNSGPGSGSPAYTSWTELGEAQSWIPRVPALEGEDHGEYGKWRAAETKVSVFVVDGPDDKRGHRPGHGDSWPVNTP